jgi:hypothetical protein
MRSIGLRLHEASFGELAEAAHAIASELAVRSAPESGVAAMEISETLGHTVDLVEAALAALVGRVDATGAHGQLGFPSAVSWLRERLGMRHGRAAERVTLAKQLPRIGLVGKLLTGGRLSVGFALAICAAVRRLDEADTGAAQDILLGMVEEGCGVGQVAKAADRITDLIAERQGRDPEPADSRRGFVRSWLQKVKSLDGGLWIKGWFNPEHCAAFDQIIGPLAKPKAQWDDRDLPQRTADALFAVLTEGNKGAGVTLIIDLAAYAAATGEGECFAYDSRAGTGPTDGPADSPGHDPEAARKQAHGPGPDPGTDAAGRSVHGPGPGTGVAAGPGDSPGRDPEAARKQAHGPGPGTEAAGRSAHGCVADMGTAGGSAHGPGTGGAGPAGGPAHAACLGTQAAAGEHIQEAPGGAGGDSDVEAGAVSETATAFETFQNETGGFTADGFVAPAESAPAESAREELAPGESGPAESGPGESAWDESGPGESAWDESALGELARDELARGESVPDKSAPRESAPARIAPGESPPERADPWSAIEDETGERAATGRRMAARLLDGTPVALEDARRIALNAGMSTLILGRTGTPLYLGRSVRFATPAQRKVLLALYDTCCVHGCQIPAHLSEVHHLGGGWKIGTPTDIDQLTMLCGWHNRWIETHQHQVVQSRDVQGRTVLKILPPWSRQREDSARPRQKANVGTRRPGAP